MFDTFYDKNINCPKCGKDISKDGFQTKEFGCDLQNFIRGQKVIYDIGYIIKKIRGGKYKCHTVCPKCHSWIEATLVIKNGRFKGIIDIKIGSHWSEK